LALRIETFDVDVTVRHGTRGLASGIVILDENVTLNLNWRIRRSSRIYKSV